MEHTTNNETLQTEFGLTELVHSLSYAQLLKLKYELETGATQLQHHIKNKITQIEIEQRGVCASCGVKLDSSMETFTLVFGPPDFRQKGSFCGIDCHEAFLGQLRGIKNKRRS